MSSIGSTPSVVRVSDIQGLAAHVRDRMLPPVMRWREDWVVYQGDRGWRIEDSRWMNRWIRNHVNGLRVEMWDNRMDDWRVTTWKASINTVRELEEALEAVCHVDRELELPYWTAAEDPGWEGWACVGFRDRVVYAGGAEGFETKERSQSWVDTMTVPVDWDEEAECPVWMGCVDQWGCGLEGWGELLQEWMGYCLLPTNRYARWMFMMGRPRSGKGTITKVLEMLMGRDACRGLSLINFGQQFGLHGAVAARSLIINEVSELDRGQGERAVQVIKSILGQDSISVDRKYRDMLQNVRISANITMVSNQIVELPNRGHGLGSKMLVLPFQGSWVGQEDTGLVDRLEDELAGIAAWAMRGAQRLVGSGGRFTECEGSEEVEREVRHTNNPMDAFLDARFNVDPYGWTSSQFLYQQYVQWCRTMGERPEYRGNTLIRALLRHSTWRLDRRTKQFDGVARRGIQGLSVKRYYQDNPEI